MSYPKVLFNGDGETSTVANETEEGYARKSGYIFTENPSPAETSVVIEDVIAEPDFVEYDGDNYYYFYKLPEEVVGEEILTYYTSKTRFTTDEGSSGRDLDSLLNTSIDFGDVAEIAASYAGMKPIDAFLADLKVYGTLNPYIFQKEAAGAVNALGEEVGGTYAALEYYLESIYEGKETSYDGFAARSPLMANLSAEAIQYQKAISLGTDRNSNATLRALEDKINLEVSGLLTQYGVPDIDDDLLNYIYNKRLTGEYGTQTLKEQFRLLVNPDLPGYRDPDLVQFTKENAVGISASKANIYKTEQLLNNQLGPQLGSGFNAEDVKFLSQLQSVPGGADQIKSILQGIWDSSVNEAYKGSSYNLTLASMRPRLIKEGNFDERGRDADFVSELLTLAPEDLNKNARKYFLSINDEGALAKMASSLKGQGLSGVIYNPA